MLISPPFLPARAAGVADEAYVAGAMPHSAVNCPGTNYPEGSFPVSLKLGWHGGTHLHAPSAGATSLPVRCIADGEIVLARRPVAVSTDPAHAQNYNPYGSTASWTDNGLVIIRHTTDIGTDANAREIVFYSVIAHLSELRGNFLRVANGTATADQRLALRKDEIGLAGSVYGAANHVHMEIACDDDSLRRLCGRATGELAVTANGRSDAVYGEIYFYLPAGTPFFAAQPADNVTAPAGGTASTEAMIVGIRYGNGNGAQPGGARVRTYRPDGTEIGAALDEADAEYTMLRRSAAIANVFTTAHAPQVPKISALFDLLRFGRVIGPDALVPDTTPHWRRANHAGGAGWVNLNAANVMKFSDADFPGWKGWKLVDDDTDVNSRCNSAAIVRLVEDAADADASLTRAELEARMSLPTVRAALSKVIAKFPSEWNRDTIDARWDWVRTDPQFGLEAPDWALFREHASALTVPAADLPDPLRGAHWHVHPEQFITHVRQCGWLSEAEMAQTLPKYLFYTTTGNPRTAITTAGATYTLTRAAATTRLATHHVELNRCMRKYIGSSGQRIAMFLAQVILETAQWRNPGGTRRLMHEWGYGATSTANPATAFYTAFYGRGIMQLTWAGNYKSYGEYRVLPNHAGAYVERLTPASPRITATSLHYLANPNDGGTQITWSPRYDPDLVGEDAHAACDSGGHYWVGKSFSGNININRASDQPFTPTSVGLINRLVNGGGNGYHERQAYAAYLIRLLTEDTAVDLVRQVAMPAPKAAITINFSRT